MAEVIWSPRAVRDLDEMSEYVARTSSESRAVKLAHSFVALAEDIPAQPYLGAVVAEYDQEDLRERQLYDYRVLYRLRGEDVELVAIFHGSRRLPRTAPEGE